MVSEKIFGDSIGGFILYAKSTVDGSLVAVKVDPTTGALKVDTEISAVLDPTGLATQTTLAAVLAKLSADPATQTTLAAILAKLIADPATEVSLSSIDEKLAALVDGQAPVIAGSRLQSTSVAFTGIGTYTAYDVCGAIVELPNFALVAGRGGVIREIGIRVAKKSMNCQFRLHIFKASNPTIAADNAQWKELWADRALWGGFLDMPVLATAADATNSDCSRTIHDNYGQPLGKFVKCAAAQTSIWLVLEMINPGATAFDSSPGNAGEIRIAWEQL